PHHEAGEQHGQRVLADRLVVAVPVAAAVVVQPGDVVVRGLFQRRARLPVQRPARPQLRDGALAALLVVHLVAGDREEALAYRILFVLLERVDGGGGEHRGGAGAAVAQTGEPLYAAHPRLGGEARGRQARGGGVGGVAGDAFGFVVGGGELGAPPPPFHGIDVRLGDLRGRPEPAVG